jgi:putative acetyltransferase
MRIGLERPDRPDIVQLIDELDAYQKPMYPPESHHGIDLAALSQPNVVFAVVRDDDDRPIGCGAVVIERDFGELKRMYLRPANRGRGLAAALLAFLEGHALARGCTRLMLETGVSQPEALAFYQREGFVRRAPFADYTDDPLSVYMEKALA